MRARLVSREWNEILSALLLPWKRPRISLCTHWSGTSGIPCVKHRAFVFSVGTRDGAEWGGEEEDLKRSGVPPSRFPSLPLSTRTKLDSTWLSHCEISVYGLSLRHLGLPLTSKADFVINGSSRKRVFFDINLSGMSCYETGRVIGKDTDWAEFHGEKSRWMGGARASGPMDSLSRVFSQHLPRLRRLVICSCCRDSGLLAAVERELPSLMRQGFDHHAVPSKHPTSLIDIYRSSSKGRALDRQRIELLRGVGLIRNLSAICGVPAGVGEAGERLLLRAEAEGKETLEAAVAAFLLATEGLSKEERDWRGIATAPNLLLPPASNSLSTSSQLSIVQRWKEYLVKNIL